MEDGLPKKWKTTLKKMKDDLKFNFSNWKMTSKKNGRLPLKKNGRRPPKKNGRRPQKKMDDDLKNQNERRPQKSKMEDDLKK